MKTMLFMIVVKPAKDSEAGAVPNTELLEAIGRYNEESAKAGVLLAAEGFRPRARGVAATRELVAGFWLIRVESKWEAIEWVRRVPNPAGEKPGMEIRQVFAADAFESQLTPKIQKREDRQRACIAATL